MARDEHGIRRRVTGDHDLRLDGIGDLLSRASGMTVLDVGCNRGMVCYEFAMNGARMVAGCDNYEKGIETAREIFSDIRNVRSNFQVVDLTQAPKALRVAFGKDYQGPFDVILLLAIVHKLKRIMNPRELLLDLARHTRGYIGWRGYKEEVPELDEIFEEAGLRRIHYSEISETICPAAIWRRDV